MPEISEQELNELKAAKTERDNLAKEKADAKTKADNEEKERKEKEGKEKDLDLNDKVKKEKEEKEKGNATAKQIEGALKFNLSIATFVKDNADLLPGDVAEIIKAADKENYDDATQKANAVKVAIMKSFFDQKDNLEGLTANQKAQLDEFQKLTKNGKEEKAASIYENIFEPALETMKRIKKAEELGKSRSGISPGSKSQDAYKEKIMKASKQTYLGEKGNS